MLKRLLFVDDEVLVLDGLRRALHGMRNEWDMTFVKSAAEALSTMDDAVFDAIITDMRMPSMDGAQLLDLIKRRHPSVVRIVLSGQAGKDAVLRSIAPAHQFLSKPCDPQELKHRLTQAFAMHDLLSNPSLRTTVSNLRSLPTLPALYGELAAELDAKESSLLRIEKIISRDVGMAAKILQLANSAFIGARGEVSNLVRAISLIGTETVRTLVLSVHVFSQFEGRAEIAANLKVLWEHSIAVAGLAQQIAQLEKASKSMIEECFAAGLLHDIGKAVLLAEMSTEYLGMLADADNCSAILSRESNQWGCTHAEVGAYLMSIWGLPAPLVQAVAFHHNPAAAAEGKFSPLAAVHFADTIESDANAFPINRDIELDRAYLEGLSLQEHEASWKNLHEALKAKQKKGDICERKDPVC